MYHYLEEFIKDNYIDIDYNEYTKNELYLMNNIIKTDNIIETNNSSILNFIGLYYQSKIDDKEDNKNKAKEYYLKAIKLNNKYAINNYAQILEEENNLEEAKEYYLKAIELNNSDAMNNYATVLENENKIKEAIEYYLKAIELNNKVALENYLIINSDIVSNLKKYIQLLNINSDITKDALIELEKDRDVLIYKNKLKKFSKIKECELCNENKQNIQLNCFYHMVCKDCYIEVYNDRCPFCRL